MRTDSFKWAPEYSVGNQMLDAQHRNILRLCDEIEKLSCLSSGYSERLHGVLHEMAMYAKSHFKTEEILLQMCNYPDVEQQKYEHLKYLEELGEILNESLEKNPDPSKLLDFLHDWWIDHILYSDMKYKAFLSMAR